MMEATTEGFPRASFEIQKIVDISFVDGKVRNYKVQWAPTWVSGIQLFGCEHLVREYLQQQHVNECCTHPLAKKRENICNDSEETPEIQNVILEGSMDICKAIKSVENTRTNVDSSNLSTIQSIAENDLQETFEGNNSDSNVLYYFHEETADKDNARKSSCAKTSFDNIVIKSEDVESTELRQHDLQTVTSSDSMEFYLNNQRDVENDPSHNIHYGAELDAVTRLNAFPDAENLIMYHSKAADLVKTCENKTSEFQRNDDANYENYISFVDISSKHNKNRAKGKSRFECSFCQKLLHSKERLVDHESTHTGARPYECIICKKKFRHGPSLRRHKKVHEFKKESLEQK